jgi:hypothetical protein
MALGSVIVRRFAAGLAESQQHAIRIISDPEFAKAFLAIGGLIGVSLSV